MKKTFNYVKEGDTVTRLLAGSIPMKLLVGKVDDEFIYCGSSEPSKSGIEVPVEHGWKFRVDNGNEVDEDLGWDGISRTGSFLIHIKEEK